MTFDLSVWKERIQERLRGWRERMQDSGVNSLYGFLCTMTLWPVAEAARAGNWTALVALGNLLAGLGTNLVAARIQSWED